MDLKTLILIIIGLMFIWYLISSSNNYPMQKGGDDLGVFTQMDANIGPEDQYLISPDYDGYDLYDDYNPYGYYGY